MINKQSIISWLIAISLHGLLLLSILTQSDTLLTIQTAKENKNIPIYAQLIAIKHSSMKHQRKVKKIEKIEEKKDDHQLNQLNKNQLILKSTQSKTQKQQAHQKLNIAKQSIPLPKQAASAPTKEKISNKTIKRLLKQISQLLQQKLWQINDALYQGLNGRLLIDFDLTPKGAIDHIYLVKSSGENTLDSIIIHLLKNLDLSKINIPPRAESIQLQLPVNFEQGS